MKNKLALATAFVAASSFSTAEIVITDFLSVEGFVDMSYSYTDSEVSPSWSPFGLGPVGGTIGESENSYQVDQVEISWLFDFDPVTAQVDLQYDEGTDSGTAVEQAFATYHLSDDGGFAITAGRYASMIGFEAFEPTGLYQFSFAYDLHLNAIPPILPGLFFPAGLGGAAISDVTVIPGYANGVKLTHESENTFFGISLQDEAFGTDGGRLYGDGDSSYAVEIAGSIRTDNGLTFFLGGAYEDAEAGDSYMLNSYVTLETGAWLFAAEVNYGESESNAFALGATRAAYLTGGRGAAAPGVLGGAVSGVLAGGGIPAGLSGPILGAVFGGAYTSLINDTEETAMQGLLMANFAYSDKASITGRFSYVNHELDAVGSYELEAFKYTLAHGYAFTDNLFLVTEVSYVDGDIDGPLATSADIESLLGAVELIFSF